MYRPMVVLCLVLGSLAYTSYGQKSGRDLSNIYAGIHTGYNRGYGKIPA